MYCLEFSKNSNDLFNSPDGSGNPAFFQTQIATNSRKMISKKPEQFAPKKKKMRLV
jgi:hypothetical protein